MARYRKVEVKTWVDNKFRQLSPMPPSGRGLWLFLMTGPFTGPIPGLFRAGRAAMAEELEWDIEAFDEAFQEVSSQGMAKADFKERLVWLPNALKHNKPESPNVVRSWRDEIELLPDCDLKNEAIANIRNHLEMLGAAYLQAFDEILTDENKASLKPSLKASRKPSIKTTPNQEQEQEQDKDQDQNTLVHGEKIATDQPGGVQPVEPGQPAGTTPEADSADALEADSGAVQQVVTDEPEQPQQPEADPAMSGKPIGLTREISGPSAGREDYPDEFEQAWCEYPRRTGANPKKSAFSAWRARLREGATPEAMLDGVRRYAKYLAATGKVGTEFVQRATTFFGPDRHFENPWELPAARASPGWLSISEPDTEIPPGFRG